MFTSRSLFSLVIFYKTLSKFFLLLIYFHYFRGFGSLALVALSLHMQVMIRIIKLDRHSLKYFHSCLTAYLKAYLKQQVRVVQIIQIMLTVIIAL